MKFEDLFRTADGQYAKKEITILGVNPIINDLIDNAQLFNDIMRCNPNVTIDIIYESSTENFNQSLFYDKILSREKNEFSTLESDKINRLIGGDKGESGGEIAGFIEDVLSFCLDETERKSFYKRISIRQNNLRQNIYLVRADDVYHFCFIGMDMAEIEDYQKVTHEINPRFYNQLEKYVQFLLNSKTGGLFLSKPGEELIQLYDQTNIPRGIYPRKAFYSTEFKRYSIWAFIFNRKGELLLHKRSDFTADNQSLWDKSAGGHVDLGDSSTIITAKRELIEELFLPEAEYTPNVQGRPNHMIDFGEWNIGKRQEKHFKGDFDGLGSDDWVFFRATEQNTGKPLTIDRKSYRTYHIKETDQNGKPLIDSNGHPVFKPIPERRQTRFISDVYLIIAPKGYMDTEEQMHQLMAAAEQRGAASQHKLVSVAELCSDIDEHPENYTEDLDYVHYDYKWLLLQFSNFIKYIFK